MPNNNVTLSSKLIQILTVSAGKIAKSARQYAINHTKIQKAIEVGRASQEKSTYKIEIRVDSTIAPEAIAFEFGSGEHAQENPQRYKIAPKNANVIAFPSNRWPKYVSPNGRTTPEYFVFPFVMHPGVEGIHYMQKAVDDHKDEFVKQVADASVTAIANILGPRIEVIR